MYFEALFVGLYSIQRPLQPMKFFIFLKIYIFEESFLILNALY